MTFETKLGFGQEAHFLRDGAAICLPVGSIQILATKDTDANIPVHPQIKYGFRLYDRTNKFKDWLYMDEDKLFITKDELRASL